MSELYLLCLFPRGREPCIHSEWNPQRDSEINDRLHDTSSDRNVCVHIFQLRHMGAVYPTQPLMHTLNTTLK